MTPWLVMGLVALAVATWPPSADGAAAALSAWRDRDGTGPAGSGARRTPGGGRRARRRTGDHRRRAQPDADAADLVALGLEAGLTVEAALALVAGSVDHPTGGKGEALEDLANRLPPLVRHGLELSAATGAPVALAARMAADAERDRVAGRARAATAMAGARASMHLLTLLPLAGPVLVGLLGLPLEEVYRPAMARAALGVGLVLTAAGWVLSRAMLARAVRVPRLVRPRAREEDA